MKKNPLLSTVNSMVWFGVICMLLSLAGFAVPAIFYFIKVEPETAIAQFKNARQALLGMSVMLTGVSFTFLCLGLGIRKSLLKSARDENLSSD